jgi:death-on-curing protein
MTNTIKTKNGKINTLTVECVRELHQLLSENYLIFHDMEPISPEGVKNNNMLESAVHRQNAGIDDYYKYSTCY